MNHGPRMASIYHHVSLLLGGCKLLPSSGPSKSGSAWRVHIIETMMLSSGLLGGDPYSRELIPEIRCRPLIIVIPSTWPRSK